MLNSFVILTCGHFCRFLGLLNSYKEIYKWNIQQNGCFFGNSVLQIDADIEKAERDLERLSGMVRSCIMLNASATLTEVEYRQQYTDLTRQYEEKTAEYSA